MSDTPMSPVSTETAAPNNVDVPADVLPESYPSHNLSPSQSILMPSKSASPKAPSIVLTDDTGMHLEGIRRSTRARRKSKFYDPSTGKCTEQDI